MSSELSVIWLAGFDHAPKPVRQAHPSTNDMFGGASETQVVPKAAIGCICHVAAEMPCH
jgi:hypothetical protein